MKYTLTLRERAHVRDGSTQGKSSTVIVYDVVGLPSGEEAQIAKMKDNWQILRIKDGVQGDRTGDYNSPQDGLAALEKEY